MARASGGFKLPVWATKVATWAFMAITGAGINVYMDTAANKQDIAVMKKTDDRHESDLAQLRTDLRKMDESSEEKTRKGLDKLDQIISMMDQRKRR